MAYKIEKHESHFVFVLDSSQGQMGFTRYVDEGVAFNLFGSDSGLAAIVFDRRKFDFNQTKEWLEAHGFKPDPNEKEQFEARNYYAPEIAQVAFAHKEITLAGVPVLLIQAIPLSPGTHKSFTFTREVIDAAEKLYDGVNLVEHHTFETPGDVKGTILRVDSKADDDGNLLVTAAIFNRESADKIRSGEFHSVSSSVLIETDNEKNVTSINHVEELTLTGRPADPGSKIISFKDVSISLSDPVFKITEVKAATMSEQPVEKSERQQAIDQLTERFGAPKNAAADTPNDPVPETTKATNGNGIVIGDGVSMHIAPTPTPEVSDSEKRVQKLENELVQIRQARLHDVAVQFSEEVNRAQLILPVQRETVTELYEIAAAAGKQDVLMRFIQHNQIAPLGGALTLQGVGAIDKTQLPIDDLTDDEVDEAFLTETDAKWKYFAGDGVDEQYRVMATELPRAVRPGGDR